MLFSNVVSRLLRVFSWRRHSFFSYVYQSFWPRVKILFIVGRGSTPEVRWGEDGEQEIIYLKPHGSLNWEKSLSPDLAKAKANEIRPNQFPMKSLEAPLILPPIFNKMNSPQINVVWKAALEILREAKNIVIVGYSLPRTDIYMQYFLKSAVGPNQNLQKIIVFDPVLFREDERTKQMESRYKECFAPQFTNRITFRPPTGPAVTKDRLGTFFHFLQTIRYHPNQVLFYP